MSLHRCVTIFKRLLSTYDGLVGMLLILETIISRHRVDWTRIRALCFDGNLFFARNGREREQDFVSARI